MLDDVSTDPGTIRDFVTEDNGGGGLQSKEPGGGGLRFLFFDGIVVFCHDVLAEGRSCTIWTLNMVIQ